MRRSLGYAALAAFGAAFLAILAVLQLTNSAGAAGGAVDVDAGGGHSCARTGAGSLHCWGANGSGQLGDGSETGQLLPVAVRSCETLPSIAGSEDECPALTGIDDVSTGFAHSCGRHESGFALCWGRNTYGQLGDATNADRSMAVAVCGEVALAGSSGASVCCPTLATATPTATTSGTLTATPTATSTPTPSATPVATATAGPCGVLSNVSSVSAGNYHTCALTGDETVWCWGENGFGQLGNGTETNSNSPTRVCAAATLDAGAAGAICTPLSGVEAIDAGSYHTCALMESGGVVCWGSNASGQLGNGTIADSSLPAAVCEATANPVGTTIAGGLCGELSGVSSITAGGTHTCAVAETSELSCWGENSSGQLGDSTSFDRSAPIATCAEPDRDIGVAGESMCCTVVVAGVPPGLECFLTEIVAASAGGEHTCAILEEGLRLLCWGGNNSGQLGRGSTLDENLPAAVCADDSPSCPAFLNTATVSAGYLHTCAVTVPGGVFCWGDNPQGKIGDGGTTDQYTPAEVVGFLGKPTPTPTSTVTPVATGTLTPNQTVTATTTASAATPTVTVTASPPSATNTPTRTPTQPAATSTRTPTPITLAGDANCDGAVTSVDAALILQLVAALIASVPCTNNVDVNDDSAIDSVDSALVLQYVAGLISALPA